MSTQPLEYSAFKCQHCEKSFMRRFNLERHIDRYHSDILAIQKRLFESLACPKCDKELSDKRNLMEHINICNGGLDTLQCTFCKKMLSLRSTKCQHLKTCRYKMDAEKQAIKRVKVPKIPGARKPKAAEIVNIYVPKVVYAEDETELDSAHITSKMYADRIHNNTQFINYFVAFCKILFENQDNQCFRKVKKCGMDFDAYTAKGWREMPPCNIKPVMCMLGDTLCTFLYSFKERNLTIPDTKKHKNLECLAEYIAGDGCNNSTHIYEYKECIKYLPKMITSLFHDMYQSRAPEP